MKQYISLLRRRPQYRNLWLASVISFAGDWFNTIASVILVNRYTDSTTAVGILFIARALPPFLLSPLAGVVADRFNRRTILLATDLLRGFIVLGFLIVSITGEAWLIYALTISQFVVSSFFQPARSAILPSLVNGSEELLLANTISSITWSAMLALGAAAGGIVAGLFGVEVAIIIDSATFFLSAFFVWRIRVAADKKKPTIVSSGWQDFLEGASYLRNRPRTALTTCVKGLTQFGSADIMIAVYASSIFPVGIDGALTLGWLYAGAGVGAILGPLIANKLGDSSQRWLIIGVAGGFVLVGGGWLFFGLAPVLVIAILAMLIRHMGGSINWTYSTVLLQERVEDRYLGRVFALDMAIFTLAMAFSVWISGLVLDYTDISARELSYIFAAGSLWPVVPWLWANSFQRKKLEERA